MGKIQIALHLTHWVKDNKLNHFVLWIVAFSMVGFEQECGKLAKKLGIRCSEHVDAKEALRQYICLKDTGNWFLIVDNADDMEIFDKSTHAGGGILDFLPYPFEWHSPSSRYRQGAGAN